MRSFVPTYKRISIPLDNLGQTFVDVNNSTTFEATRTFNFS